MTRTEIDQIVREHTYTLLSEIITELSKRGFRQQDPHNTTAKKSSIVNTLYEVRQLYC